MKHCRKTLPILMTALLLNACSLTPAYHPPKIDIVKDSWKDKPWQLAKPADNLPRGNWWSVYQDATLNTLEEKIDQDNPDLAAVLARYDQAMAFVAQSRASQFPEMNLGSTLTQNRQSDNRPLRGTNQPDIYAANTIGIAANYDLDIWGKVRSQIAEGKANAQASAADIENIKLSLQAQLAKNYVQLRGIDVQKNLLDDTIQAYMHALQLTQNRHEGGISSGLDVARAKTQLRSIRAEVAALASQRAIFEHAIATLIDVPAMNFSLPTTSKNLSVPGIPLLLPSTLLQRRPDIAAAERHVAAANAAIGVARAAYFPDFSIGAGYGYQNTGAANLLSAPNSFWNLGPGLVLNLFDGGAHDAKLAQAKATMAEASAVYRATSLLAFQQVQDALSLLKFDSQGEFEQNEAVKFAGRTLSLATNRYREGAATYLDVVTAQTTMLLAQRQALQLHTRQLVTSVDLIHALGGGWVALTPQNEN